MAPKPGSPPLWFVFAIFAGMAVAAAFLAWALASEQDGAGQAHQTQKETAQAVSDLRRSSWRLDAGRQSVRFVRTRL